jgi:hypothetical protein
VTLELTLALAPAVLRPCPFCEAIPTLTQSPAGSETPWAHVMCANALCLATASVIAFADTAEDARVQAGLAWNGRAT